MASHAYSTSRRQVLGSIAAAPLVGAALMPSALAGSTIPTTPELLQGYSEWLYYERLLLAKEMYPGHDRPERWIPACGLGANWHFRSTFPEKEEDLPRPSSRAALVMQAVGAIDATGRSWNRDDVRPPAPHQRSRERLVLDYAGFIRAEVGPIYQEMALLGHEFTPIYCTTAQDAFGGTAPSTRAAAVLAAVGL